jgi:molybdenum cofactor cytidylyltransferase
LHAYLQFSFLLPNGISLMPSIHSIAPIILAAGDSTRMGYPKALLPLGEEIFITRILRILRDSGMPRPIIILGKAESLIRERIRNWPADIRINPNPDRGQLSSIQIALSSIGPEFDACLIWPVDQPAVSENLVRHLAQLFVDSGSLMAFPSFGNRKGHPAFLHRSLFQEFMDAPLEEGPKKIVTRHEQETALLPTDESAVVQDIDTPEEYEALTGESPKSALARTGIS